MSIGSLEANFHLPIIFHGHVQIRGNRFFGPEKQPFLFFSIFGHIFDARVFIFEDRVLCATF